MSRLDREVVTAFKTDEFTVKLFDTGSALFLINKDESYVEDLLTSGKAKGMEAVESGVSRLLNVSYAECLFEDDHRLLKNLILALKDYIDFIGWDKTQDGEGLKLTLNSFKKETMEYILNLDRDLKDIWAIFSSLSTYYFSPHVTAEIVETIIEENHKQSFENLVADDLDGIAFNSCVAYLLPSFPVVVETKIKTNTIALAVNLLNSTDPEATVSDFVESDVIPERLNDISERNQKALSNFLKSSDFNKKKKSGYRDDEPYGNALNKEDFESLTKEEFVQYFIVAPSLYTSSEKRYHFNRVKSGLKFDHTLNIKVTGGFSNKVYNRMTEEEIARGKKIEAIAPSLFDRLYEDFLFESFVEHPEVFENFANDFDSSVAAFIELSKTENKSNSPYAPYVSSSDFIGLLKKRENYRKLYNDYMNGPEMSFEMMLRIEDVVSEGDHISRRQQFIV